MCTYFPFCKMRRTKQLLLSTLVRDIQIYIYVCVGAWHIAFIMMLFLITIILFHLCRPCCIIWGMVDILIGPSLGWTDAPVKAETAFSLRFPS